MFLQLSADIKQRRLSGVAHSGKPFMYQGRRYVVDLDSIQLGKVPLLHLHNRAERVGMADLSLSDEGLVIEGDLLDNPIAQGIIDDADKGFAWQLSAHFEADEHITLTQDQCITINQQALSYPLTVLKGCTVREVSFTPTGVDKFTHAAILSEDNPMEKTDKTDVKANSQTDNAQNNKAWADKLADKDKTISELQALVASLQEQIKQLGSAKKQADLEAKLSQNGFVKDGEHWQGLSSATINMLLSCDDKQVDVVLQDLKPKVAPTVLLSESYETAISKNQNPLLAVIG